MKYFDETEGLDPTVTQILNEKLKYVKEIYEQRIQDHIKYQHKLMIELVKYKSLTPDSYGFLNYTLEEIFQNLRIVEMDADKIWNTMKSVFGKTFFTVQVQHEYNQSFSENDKKVLEEEIVKIKNEAERNVASVTDK